MRAENLTFLEAVQALKDGKCRAIRRPDWAKGAGYKLNTSGLMVELFAGQSLLVYPPCILATDWQLIDPVPEKRTVKGWTQVVVRKSSVFTHLPELCCASLHTTAEGAATCGGYGYRNCGDAFYIEHTYEVTE